MGRQVAKAAGAASRRAGCASSLRAIEHSLPLQLLKAREDAMARFRPMLRRHGLTEQQWRVVRVLAEHGGIDATELAKRSFLLAPSLTRILRHLERQGLVARSADVNDQRRSFFVLTHDGTALFAQVAPDSERIYASIERAFGRDNLDRLNALLADFSASLEGSDDG
jgi:homoprotocatechuate degradation regulator HpaR